MLAQHVHGPGFDSQGTIKQVWWYRSVTPALGSRAGGLEVRDHLCLCCKLKPDCDT